MGKELNFTEEEMLNAIKGSAGIISTIADNLNCQWHSAHKYIQKYESAKQAYEDECERMLDTAESELKKLIEKGDPQMIRYILSTKGKKRGFSEKQEIEHSGNVDGNINITLNPVRSLNEE